MTGIEIVPAVASLKNVYKMVILKPSTFCFLLFSWVQLYSNKSMNDLFSLSPAKKSLNLLLQVSLEKSVGQRVDAGV